MDGAVGIDRLLMHMLPNYLKQTTDATLLWTPLTDAAVVHLYILSDNPSLVCHQPKSLAGEYLNKRICGSGTWIS
jgi:hypothetical protein